MPHPTLYLIGAILLAQSVCSRADQVVQGERGNWNVKWCGVNAEKSSGLGGAAAYVGRALEAAKVGGVPQFYELWQLDTNSPPEVVKSWYEEWHSQSQRYVYLIGEAAVLVSGTNAFAAVSIAPAVPRESIAVSDRTNRITLQARVVFAKQVGSNWTLLPETVDQKVEQALLARAASLVHQPQVNFTKEGLEKQDQQFNKNFLEMMRKNGASPERIASQEERYQAERSGGGINDWSAWTNRYKAVVVDPPVKFERRELFPYDFSNPISAFRSHMYAKWTGDAKTLLKYADASGQRDLKKAGVDESVKRVSYSLTNVMTHITILLTASTGFQGQDYFIIFWRAQNEINPQYGSIALQSTMFIKQDGDYLYTRTLEDSYLGSLLVVARARGGIWKYPDFEKKMKQSTFPPHFYAIP